MVLMGKRIEYQPNEILNYETRSQYIKELPQKNKVRYALIRCGSCGKEYEAPIKKVKAGHLCLECGRKKNTKNRTIYYTKGQILNEIGSTYVEFIERTPSGAHKARIKCGLCGQEYITDIKCAKRNAAC